MPPSIPTSARIPQNLHHLAIFRQHRKSQIGIDIALEPQIYIYLLFVSACFAGAYNLPINHIGITVPDLDAAIEWYNDIFGWKKVRSSTMTDRALTPNTTMFRIYGDELQQVKTAFLTTGNGVGIEVFEFVDPPYQPPASGVLFDYTRAGVSHISVTTPDVDDMIQRMKEKGGKQIGETLNSGKDLEGIMRKAAYVLDPWGTVVELLSVSYEALLANRG